MLKNIGLSLNLFPDNPIIPLVSKGVYTTMWLNFYNLEMTSIISLRIKDGGLK